MLGTVLINEKYYADIIKIVEPYLDGAYIPEKSSGTYDENYPEELPLFRFEKMLIQWNDYEHEAIKTVEIESLSYKDDRFGFKYEYDVDLEIIKSVVDNEKIMIEVIE